MPGRSVVVIALVVSVSTVAAADGVGNEVTVGTSEATAGNPSTAYVSNRLWLSTDIRDVVTLRAEGSFTRDAAASPGGWTFDDQGGNIFRLATSVDVYLSDHITLGLEGTFSPETETTTSTPITYVVGGASMAGYAQVLSTSSNYGFLADAEYDTAGESNLEWVAGAGVGVQTFSAFQRLGMVTDQAGTPIAPERLTSTCDSRDCPSEITAALQGEQDTLRQVRVGANGLATIYEDTDVGLGAAYYMYTSDPTALGYFSLAALGRDQVLGEGMHYAPLRFTARPSVVQRIGRVQLGSWFEYGRYVADEGDAFTLGLRVQVKLGAFRVWCAAVGQQDRGGPEDSPRSASVSLGARVRF